MAMACDIDCIRQIFERSAASGELVGTIDDYKLIVHVLP
jgi:hypothetical protein